MRVISKKTLRTFWDAPRAPDDSQTLLVAWYKLVLAAGWRNFADLRQTFDSADTVGDCVVFNVGGNKYRVIGRVRYANQRQPGVVYILKVMTHAEYDENKWPDECGCHAKRASLGKKRRGTRRPKPRET